MRRLKSSSGCCFWISASCCAAVFRMSWVLPVSRRLLCYRVSVGSHLAIMRIKGAVDEGAHT